MTGIVRAGDKISPSLSPEELAAALEATSKYLPLTTEDIYKELRLQGYEYHGSFKGIKLADNEGKGAKELTGKAKLEKLETVYVHQLKF